MRKLIIGAAAQMALALVAASAIAAPKKTADLDYGRDLISVATPGRHAIAATGDCTVWINAEGLGVGPAQLDGLHGLVMHINVAPLSGDHATALAAGLAELKASSPKAPAWLFAALQKNQAAIERGCAEDHPDPMKVASLRAADKTAK